MTEPYYRATVKLERVHLRDPDAQGYIRTDVDELSEVLLTGGTERNVLDQAHRHVGVLVETYTPILTIKAGGRQ